MCKPSECMRPARSIPAGWSELVFTQHRGGLHGRLFNCGLGSRGMALKVAALQCDRVGQPQLRGCAATELYDPDGRPQQH